MKFYSRSNQECLNKGCKCVECMLNHNNEKYKCFNCSTCSRDCFGNIKYDHLKKDCGSYIKRGSKKK